jgi:hypothetical protein
MSERAFVSYGERLLEKMAAERGWKRGDSGTFWATRHLGIALGNRGACGASDFKVIVKTVVASLRYRELAKGWRKLVGIEEEDRRSVLELVASFPAKEGLIAGAEIREEEELERRKREYYARIFNPGE